MNYFFTADTHFGHENIIRYCQRPFTSAEEMDSEITERWNAVVKPKDIVYHLGDFALVRGSRETRRAYYRDIVDSLNGSIILIPGSHDKDIIKAIHEASAVVGARFNLSLAPPLYTITIKGQRIVLCHYAMRIWPESHYDSWQLFGHSHGHCPTEGQQMDVGVDCSGFKPNSFDEVAEWMATRPPNPNSLSKRFEK